MPKVIVIGAGVAGLATAIRMANAGYSVEVFEQNAYVGGKLSQFSLGKYRFDAGPSLFTMPQFVDELFLLAGKNPRDYYQYEKKSIICNYFYEDGERLTASSDLDTFSNEIHHKFGFSKEKFKKYFQKSAKKYELTHKLFLEQSLHKYKTYFSTDTIKAIAGIPHLDIFTTLHQVNESFFKGFPHLIQLFDRFATYNGSSPYLTPGIMSMIPHLEQNVGTFIPKNGMYDIASSLHRLALELGVTFHLNQGVSEIIIKNKKAIGIKTQSATHAADVVVSNMDIVPTYRYLMPTEKAPEKTLSQPRSSSALIFYWGIKHSFPQLDLHNIFFSKDYDAEFQDIFENGIVNEDPTVYVDVSSKNVAADAPENAENWFVMVNVPANAGQNWSEMIPQIRKNVLAKLSRLLEKDIASLIEEEEILDPIKIESKTGSYQGALYGAASNNPFAAFLRHPNFNAKIENLYFCGGSVHPGGGIPLCLLSAKITSELILNN